jgi:hypothetical protein
MIHLISVSSSSFWWLQAFLDLLLSNTNLSLCLFMAFSASESSLLLSLIKILVIGYRVYVDNPG